MTLSGKAWALVSSLLLWSCVAVMAEPGKSITVEARKIPVFLPQHPDRKHFVELEFLGGLKLSSEDKGFGGVSGFRMLNDDAFLAISDKGKWFSGKRFQFGKLHKFFQFNSWCFNEVRCLLFTKRVHDDIRIIN